MEEDKGSIHVQGSRGMREDVTIVLEKTLFVFTAYSIPTQ